MTAERIGVGGLTAPVEILVDRWGVPHIRASNTADLFFAQGFNAARDRLWQIDLWRKRGLGQLAADFGPGYLAQDRASRLFLYRGDMDEEWAAYGPDARAICEAFTAGINAYIDLLDREPGRLPPEFGALNTHPAKWRADDVVRIRTHGWTRNALSEGQRAQVMAVSTAEVDRLRLNLEPPVTPYVAPDLDLASIATGVLDAYRLATAPVTFSTERLNATLAEAWRWATVGADGDVTPAPTTPASNNWAIHGSRTSTGRPILANDPHRLHAVPSLRYLVHLSAPDLDLIGAVEPSFPGITIGHNGVAAFGLTLFLGPDQEDVYVYETSPNDGAAYRYGSGWERLRTVEETFEIRGASPVVLALAYTRHGPVVFEDADRRRLFAIRTIWSEPGTAPYGAGLLTMRSREIGAFRDALRRWRAPAVNQVYADRSGTIAWMTAGLVPLRRTWDGLLPVPGDGRYEWDGYLDPDVLPRVVNPPGGFVSSANAFNLPVDWDHERNPMGREWDDPSRRDRLSEVLSADPAHSVAASRRLQTDTLSLPARRLSSLLSARDLTEPNAAAGAALLGKWDCRLRADSAPAAFFEVWWTRHLRPALIASLVPDARVRALIGPGDLGRLLDILEGSRGPGFQIPGPDVVRLLSSSLSDAFRHCCELMGPDPSVWAWGRLHQWRVRHALSPLAPGGALAQADVGPFPVGGSESTPMKGAYRPSDFQVLLGASVRLVVDVGDWDRSVWINSPGQSGDPHSPHYADLAPLWAAGEYVPMLYSANAVDAAVNHRIELVP